MGSTRVGGKEGWVKGEVEWDAEPVEAPHNPEGNDHDRVPFGAGGGWGERAEALGACITSPWVWLKGAWLGGESCVP